MTVAGIDPRWKDVPDYILGITREIWEERRIHTLQRHYATDIVVRSPASVVVGNAGVIAATMATLAEFPDRQLLGEEVIWHDDPVHGTLSSHRLLSTATHRRGGIYGEANGTPLRYRILADCAIDDGAIVDEWLVRDQGAIVRQLGLEPKTWAAALIEREGGPERCVRPLTPDTDVEGPYRGRGNDVETGRRYADLLERLMRAEMSTVPETYDRACRLELPGGVTAHGVAAADEFWMSLRASFPSATFRIEHVLGLEEAHAAPRAAVRWSLHGRHDGFGSFGPPTGAEIYVLGIGHAEFGPRGLRREWVLIDETAVWKQILMQTG